MNLHIIVILNTLGMTWLSTEMNAGIACHSGFCMFQPVRKKHSFLSANNNTLAKLKAGFVKGKLAVASAVRSLTPTPSYAFA